MRGEIIERVLKLLKRRALAGDTEARQILIDLREASSGRTT